MYIKWIFLFLICKKIVEGIESDSTRNGESLQTKINTKDIGRMKYRDGEVVIIQNQQKYTEYFFTPFPYLQPSETECHENPFNDRIELGLHVELYMPQLIQAIKDYLYKYQSTVCGNTTSSFECDVSLLPMNSIRLVQKGSRSNSSRQKYMLEDAWQSATLRLQSMEFILYASNMSVCEQLRRSLTGKCRLPNFELHYSSHGPQIVQKQLEVNTEHVTSTNMYNQIRAQFSSVETVLLTGNDFEELVSQSIEQITMTLRQQEGFENLEDPRTINRLLEQQLSTEQVHLELMNDNLWENLYWTSESTRPDRLTKILGSIFRKENDDSEHFIYDRQAAKDAVKVVLRQHDHSGHHIDHIDLQQGNIDDFNSVKQHDRRTHLTYREKQSLGYIDTLFHSLSRVNLSSNIQNYNDEGKDGLGRSREFSGIDRSVLHIVEDDLNITQIGLELPTSTPTNNVNATKIDQDTDKQYTMSRKTVEKFLRAFFNSVHLVGDIIKPRSINVRLVKIGKLNTNTKLFSNMILVRIRSNVQVLPLRCKPDDNVGKSNVWLTDRVDQMESILRNLNNHTEITKLYDEIKNVRDKISVVENKTGETITNWNKEMDNHTFNRINIQIDKLNTELTNRMNQNINNPNTSIINKITLKIDNLAESLTNMIKQDINTASSTINTRIDNLEMNLPSRMNGAIESIAWPKHSSTLGYKKYQRPNRTETSFSYEFLNFTVPVSRNYDIVCFSSMDTYGYIYENSFDPTSPFVNLIKSNDDGNRAGQFKLNIDLQTGTEYILVVTTFHANVTGAFTIYTNAKIDIITYSSFG